MRRPRVATWFALGCLAVAVPAQWGKPTRAHANSFLSTLDSLFTGAAYDDYLGSFTGDLQPVFDAELRNRLENLRLFDGLGAKSEIVDFFPRGSVGVALVDTKYSRSKRSFHITTFIGIERRDSKTTGRFAIEVDATRAKARGRPQKGIN